MSGVAACSHKYFTNCTSLASAGLFLGKLKTEVCQVCQIRQKGQQNDACKTIIVYKHI